MAGINLTPLLVDSLLCKSTTQLHTKKYTYQKFVTDSKTLSFRYDYFSLSIFKETFLQGSKRPIEGTLSNKLFHKNEYISQQVE